MGLAFCAVAANMPWAIQAYLAGDRIAVSGSWVTGLLSTAGLFTGVVLTAGCCYLAHSSWMLRSAPLAFGSLAVLLLEMALLAPLRVAQLSGVAMHEVLDTPGLRWGWSLLAVIAPDAVAALCSWAASAHGREQERGARAPVRALGAAEMSIAGTPETRERVARRAARSKPAPDHPDYREQTGHSAPVACMRCGRQLDGVKAMAGHMRWCRVIPNPA